MSLNARIDRLLRLVPPPIPESTERGKFFCDLLDNPLALAEYIVQFGDEIPRNLVAAIRGMYPKEIENAAIKYKRGAR